MQVKLKQIKVPQVAYTSRFQQNDAIMSMPLSMFAKLVNLPHAAARSAVGRGSFMKLSLLV